MIAVMLNLFTNATFSLLVGLLVVGFFIWFFRIETGPWKVFLLSLPFLKIVYDVYKGLPQNSILLAGLDPFNLPPKHQILRMGVGFDWIPTLDVTFSVKGPRGQELAASVGDYLVIWLYKQFGFSFLFFATVGIFFVAFCFLSLRAYKAMQFEKIRKKDRMSAQTLKRIGVGYRFVDIYLSQSFSGSPFTGGWIRPYICIPLEAYAQLSSEEREAVIQHELGHIHQWDLLVTLAVQILGDLFWFVPGYRWLSRKIDRMREVVADQWAVENGTNPAMLASALIKLQEIPETSGLILYSAFFREKSLLKIRIEKLIGKTSEKPNRFGWRYPLIRWSVSAWVLFIVAFATLGGNH